jgi:hypothetical protein
MNTKKQKVTKGPVSPKEVKLPFVRTTPGTHVYGMDPTEPIICKQVYLFRGELPDPPPDSITLTVSW